ncbi:beta-ketoacyl-ACP synthase III [Amycolatopsis sp. NPDC003676]
MTGRVAVLEGLGSSLPPNVVTNAELAARMDTSDEWIRSRTGVGARRWAGRDVATSDLAVDAGQLALSAAPDGGIDAVVVVTSTPDHHLPATAPAVAARLGMTGVAAFDVAAVCSGFVYGLAVSSGLIASGVAERVLLIGAETYSTILDPDDRTTRAIFGDAAAAAVLRAGDSGEPGAVAPCVLGSDGGNGDLIMIPAGGSHQRSTGVPADPADFYFRMKGGEVYRHAVERMTAAADTALRHRGWTAADVDRFVPHQANARISAAVGARLGIGAERHLANIAEVGNTAAASIPLLLTESAAAGDLRPGHRVLLTAFGGGLAWGATTLVWPDITALPKR